MRRRLPNRYQLAGMVSEPPIRILLVSPRPEDKRAGYIDHRASALPLVTALESLGALAELTVLTPPNFPALVEELNRARKAKKPYHVVHFDGHGVFMKKLGMRGLGGLCFEDPQDEEKLEKRRSKIIDAEELAGVMREERIPLVFLEACQSAKAEQDPTASVAAALLEQGVASVVAMSHSVLVETAKRFVWAFYGELIGGSRVGDAMLAGQRALKNDSFRLKIFGAGRLDLQDWFVPVLYQEREDLQLLTRVPGREVREIDRLAMAKRFGELPEVPAHQFIGRSRELLKLERILERESYAVVCGQGGEGKTTLAVELARWLVRSGRFQRAVFVCLEDVYDVRTVVDRVGRQLLPNYSVSEYAEGELLTKALQPVERELWNRKTVILLDNLESLLPTKTNKSFCGGPGGGFLEKSPLEIFFTLCRRLLAIEGTRVVFTSREDLPEPFAGGMQRVRLGRLGRDEAVELVHRVMAAGGLEPKEDDIGTVQPEVGALVEAVNCHARALVLLAPYISRFGVRLTTENLGILMADLQRRYPDERERSLFASVELSLRRLSPGIRAKLKPLGVFQGGANLYTLTEVLQLTEAEREVVVREMQDVGLAEMMAYGFLRFDPGLCPYLLTELDGAGLAESTARWVEAMRGLSTFLYNECFKDAQKSFQLTTLELPNLVRLLDLVRAQGEAEATVGLATRLEQLVAQLGQQHLLARIVSIREEETKKIAGWGHTRFESSRAQIERLLGRGDFPQALQEARALVEKCEQAGEGAYGAAAYDTAMVHILLGQVLKRGGAAASALLSLAEAHTRFQRLADQGIAEAIRMASVSLTDKGDCFLHLGRLEEAAEAYEEVIGISVKLKDERQVAVGKGQLGTVRMFQQRYEDALRAHDEAREIFENLGEPAMVAVAWHQAGIVHEQAGWFEAAEQAYRQALTIRVQQNIPAEEAASLNQLGNLYDKMGRLEESVIFLRQAADKFVLIKDLAKEGAARGNLAIRLIKLKQYPEARQELHRAIECKKPYGHSSEPWKTWAILCDLEQAEGNGDEAARAREQALQLYLAYRRDGGENYNPGGRLCQAFRQARQENQAAEMAAMLAEIANNPEITQANKALIPKLQALLAGSRDPGLAADPDLDYDDAAEIVLLLEEMDG